MRTLSETTSRENRFAAIPAEMKAERRWCLWRAENREIGSTKVPYLPDGSRARSNAPETWCSHDEAVEAYQAGGYTGLGFMLGGGWAGVDLDDVIDGDGVLNDTAQEIVDQLASYTEVSPSGLGVKVFVRGELTAGRRGKIDGVSVEVYGAARYFTTTGQHLADTPRLVRDASGSLSAIAARLPVGGEGTIRDASASWPDCAGAANLAEYRERVEQLPEAVAGENGSSATIHAACEIRRWELNEDDSWELMQHFNSTRCSPPWDETASGGSESLKRKFNEGCRKVLSARVSADDEFSPVVTGQFALTELGNAERIAKQYGDTLRYVSTWKRWLCWDGIKWANDTTGVVMRNAKASARSILNEANQAAGERRVQIVKHALGSESHQKLKAAINLAETEKPIAIEAEAFDADPMRLNTDDGTIDLATGELRPHSASDHQTKTTGTGYATGGNWMPGVWEGFLDRTFGGDTELIGFVQRLFGYALIGNQTEHYFPILWGGGANGKSVLVGAFQHALGDYATTAAPKLFVTKRHDSHPTELADLAGRRLVVLNESESGASLNEALIKSLTGGDQIKARKMRQDFWEFKPSFLPVMVTNHRPSVHGVDEGMWRRLLLIPFEAFIPPADRDAELPRKLRAVAPGILRWLVEGCLAYQSEGLERPSTVKAATDAYRAESDPLYQWLASSCRQGVGLQAGATELLESFNASEQHAGREPLTAKDFASRLVAAGFVKTRHRQGARYKGLEIKG